VPDAGSPRPDDQPDGAEAPASDVTTPLVEPEPVGPEPVLPAAPVVAEQAAAPDPLASSPPPTGPEPVRAEPAAVARPAPPAVPRSMPPAAPPAAADAPVLPPAAAASDAAPPADVPAVSPPRRVGRGPVALLVVLALLAVLGTGWLAWQVREQSRAETARTEALAAARDAARLLFSYDHEQLEQDFEAGLAVTTGDFREEYERTTREVVTPVATEYDAVVQAEVVEAGVVSTEPDRAVVVVYVNQTTTSTRVEGPKIDQSRVRMVLRHVDGDWLVDRVDAL
jgi:Mce-associated membrane protein